MSKHKNLQIGNREMLHNQVCSILRSAILRGDFEPGERLVQTELAEMIGVSRMPIREALRTLEIEGLVTMEPHKGAVVRVLEKEDVEEIYELRSVLESLALKKSMQHFAEEDRRLIKQYHDSMVEATTEEYIELNKEFHDLLTSSCESPRLLGFINTISRGLAQDTPLVIPGQMKKSNTEHEKIVQAILENDADGAAEHLAEHIHRTGRELVKYLDEKQA